MLILILCVSGSRQAEANEERASAFVHPIPTLAWPFAAGLGIFPDSRLILTLSGGGAYRATERIEILVEAAINAVGCRRAAAAEDLCDLALHAAVGPSFFFTDAADGIFIRPKVGISGWWGKVLAPPGPDRDTWENVFAMAELEAGYRWTRGTFFVEPLLGGGVALVFSGSGHWGNTLLLPNLNLLRVGARF